MNPLGDRFNLERAVLTSGELQFSTKQGVDGEIEAFVAKSTSDKFPLEVVHLKTGSVNLLPVSVDEKTTVRFVGEAPLISAEPDKHGNMKMHFNGVCAVEVTFYSEAVGARGRNRGSRGKRKIFIVG